MASPVWQAVATPTVNSTATTSIALNKPAGVVSGDLMIAEFVTSGNQTISSTPTGWTLIRQLNNGTDVKHFTYWKVAGAGEPTSYTWQWTNSIRNAGTIHRITGAHATTPVEGSAVPSTGSDSNPDPPSYTPGSSQDYLFIACFGQAAKNNSSTPPTNYTERSDYTSSGGGANNAHAAGSLATRALTTGAAENPGTFTSATNSTWVAQTIAIQPAAGGASPQTITVNEPTESEAAQTITVTTAISIGVNEPTETESAQAVTTQSTISVSVGSATETEAAQAVTTQSTISVSVGSATETEAAQAVTPTQPAGSQNIAVNAVSESESAEPIAFARSLVQARPDADLDASDWETAPTASQPLYQQVDEVATDDTDYIYADLVVI